MPSGVLSKVPVDDPFQARLDPALPTVARALDPATVKDEFRRGLPRLAGSDGQVIVKSIRVIRHKPGKRCVIEYDVRLERDRQRVGKAILIGKIRAKRSGNESYRLQDALWKAGFDHDSPDQISVPEPVGVLPDLRLWLQRRAPGLVVSEVLAGPDGVIVSRRVAEGLHKLHRAGVPTERVHSMEHELEILRECMGRVMVIHERWRSRLKAVMAACSRLGQAVPGPATCGIHRDFYPAQVIVHEGRVTFIDFDLYCQGDPALDAGNFIAHVTEESLRNLGDAGALRDREEALENRFVELSGESIRFAVRAYATLTLARHIYLSTQFPERQPFTGAFLELCEQRLALG